MRTLSKLFSGYMGSGQIVKNGKFSTTKNNHNRDKRNRPTVIDFRSMRLVKLWEDNKDKLPSYLNPVYRQAYHQPKRTR
jgi:hypothetical protein